jgi:hypothetical protein
MKSKYLVFYGYHFYPRGGWEDFEDEFNTIEEAIEYIKNKEPHYNWAHIVFENKIVMNAVAETENMKDFTWIFEKIKSNNDKKRCKYCSNLYEVKLSDSVCDECFPKCASKGPINAYQKCHLI